MEKTLKIKIDNKGEVKGTVGWLLSVADHVRVGKTKSGNQAAWLKSSDGTAICTLAVRGWWDDSDKVDIVIRVPGRTTDELSLDFACSDACYSRIREIAEESEEIMDEIWEKDKSETLKLVRQ